MTIALVTRGMIAFGGTGATVIVGDVESEMEVIRETDIPEISGVNDVRPSMSTRTTSATDVRPTITRVRNTKPDMS